MATIKFTDLSQNYDPVQSGVIPFVDISGGNTHYKISQYDLTKKPAFVARLSGDQTITGSVNSKVFANLEDIDSHNYYNTTTQKFVPLKSGYYFLNSTATYNTNIPSDTLIYARIYKNGTSIAGHSTMITTGNSRFDITIDVSAISYSNGTTGDYFEAYTYHDAVANQSLSANATIINFMGHGI